MQLADLKPGVYRLTRAVTNPKPDKRHKEDHDNWPMMPKLWKGFRFRVVDAAWRFRDHKGWTKENTAEKAAAMAVALNVPGLYTIENFDGRFHKDKPIWSVNDTDEPAFAAYLRDIVDALEPAPIKPDVFFSDRGLEFEKYAEGVIISMLRHGLLTWEQLDKGIAAHHADGEEEAARNEGRDWKDYEHTPEPVYTPPEVA